MLKVLPIQSKLKQEEICLRCGVKYMPEYLAYAATVNEELAGVCQFRVTDKGGMIYDLAPVKDSFDYEAMFVLGRGTLNFIDLCGVKKAFFLGTADEKLLSHIGFSKNAEGVFEVSLEGFFEAGHCGNHCKE